MTTTRGTEKMRAAKGRSAICGLLAAFALLAISAPASASRTQVGDISPFSGPQGVAVDGSGNVWVTDSGQAEVRPPGRAGFYKYDPFPSQTMIAVPETFKLFEFSVIDLQLASDHSTENLFVASSNGRVMHVFDEDANLLRTWDLINGLRNGDGIYVAIDNTGSPSSGRVYVTLGAPENDVEAYDADQRPVQFPATAPYIKGHTLTGTPSGPFGKVGEISVDADGTIYVTDFVKDAINVFASTGEYIRTLPAPTAERFCCGNAPMGGTAVDPTDGTLFVTEGSYNGTFDTGGIAEFDRSGNPIGRIHTNGRGVPAVDQAGHLYVTNQSGEAEIYGPGPSLPTVSYSPVSGETSTGGTLNATVDPDGGPPVTGCTFQYGTTLNYSLGTVACTPDPAAAPPGSNFSTPTAVSTPLAGLSAGTTYHYRAVAVSANGTTYGADQTYTPQGVVGLRTDPASEVAETSAQLNGSLVGDGTPTQYLFEWGRTASYGNTTATAPGKGIGSPGGPGRVPVAEPLTGLEPFTTYHFRVVATGGSGTSIGEDRSFTTPPGIPAVGEQSISDVQSDRASLHAQVDPNGAITNYHFEYVDDPTFQESQFANAEQSADTPLGMGNLALPVSVSLDGLEPNTLYHYRVVGENSAGIGLPNVDRTFKTYKSGFEDKCPNAHVRQQTGAAYLFDCRAYELASAANAGGYDVESDLIPGQTPFGGFPHATGPSQLLYGVHDGGIPGTGNTTNHGVDPYVATRDEAGWTTQYVGIPADNPFASGPFASTVIGAAAHLDSFVFGGPDICSPCFSDGKTGQPVRLADGSLVQGMVGSLDPGPGAESEGYIGRSLSADGSQFVFGSTSKFEPDGNSNGDVSIYSRDLDSGVTDVVSKTPGGQTMTGPGIGQLDISSDGDRVLFGQLVSTDTAGNRHWHLYMNVENSGASIDLMPGTSDGGLYAGMSEDGRVVYFTTDDTPTGSVGGDGDTSADLFRADVTAGGATVTRVSTGEPGTGETDACDPAANTRHPRWNSLAVTPDCDVLAVGGGGGVAPSGDAVYFLSPEQLDTSTPGSQPVLDAPNLYVARPGDAPRFVATLESSANAPLPLSAHPFKRFFGAYGNAIGAAIDESNGDIYVLDIGIEFGGTGSVYKYDSEGHSELAFGKEGAIPAGGVFGIFNLPTSIAVDNDPTSPAYRNLYVPAMTENKVKIFSPAGAPLGDLEVPFPTSVAVDPGTGNVYAASLFNFVFKFGPEGAALGAWETGPSIFSPTGIAVDSVGHVYVSNGGGLESAVGKVQVFDYNGTPLSVLDPGPAKGVAVDAMDDHVYVDKGNEVLEFDPSGNPVGSPTGAGILGNSASLGVAGGTLAVSNRGSANIATFGPAVTPVDPAVDNPVVVDSLREASTRRTGDFQVNSSGDDALFTSVIAHTGYENAGHREIFRYHEPTGAIDCASCKPTEEAATADATLARNGLSLSDDGRVFFNSYDSLVDRDLNKRQDVYEWIDGVGTELISTGTGPLDSSLLGVSADATDAYFFTRDVLVKEDFNGSRVKVYDARAGGGFPYIPPPVPCKASDECHGPGTVAAAPPAVGSVAGTPVGNLRKAARTCRKRFVKRGKKCVKRHRRHKRRRHHSDTASGKRDQGKDGRRG
jgi:hypothetical protein